VVPSRAGIAGTIGELTFGSGVAVAVLLGVAVALGVAVDVRVAVAV